MRQRGSGPDSGTHEQEDVVERVLRERYIELGEILTCRAAPSLAGNTHDLRTWIGLTAREPLSSSDDRAALKVTADECLVDYAH